MGLCSLKSASHIIKAGFSIAREMSILIVLGIGWMMDGTRVCRIKTIFGIGFGNILK